MLKKLWRNRRGVSVVFSHVLMLLVIIIAWSMLFAYVANYVSDYQRGHGAALMEHLLIEDVWFDQTQILNIAIYNYGEISAKVVAVFIDGAKYTIADPVDGYVTIAVGECESIVVDFLWSGGSSYNIKLLTERGYTVEGDFAAP